MAYDYRDVSLDDLERIVSNKRKSQNIYTGTQKWDSPEQAALKASNDEIRKKYGIVGDNLALKTAEDLLRQKQEATNPINKTGLPVKDTTIYKTPFTEPLLKGVEGRQSMLFGDGINNVMDNPVISAMRKESEKAGENAYNSAIGNMTEFTGGRLNSWAAKAAADSKQAYADKGDADVANYVQMLLSGQKSFTDDAFNYDTGYYNRDYQERQTPILNEQKNKELAIDELLAKGNIANNRLSAGASARNAATNAAELAWKKDPNNPNNATPVGYNSKIWQTAVSEAKKDLSKKTEIIVDPNDMFGEPREVAVQPTTEEINKLAMEYYQLYSGTYGAGLTDNNNSYLDDYRKQGLIK